MTNAANAHSILVLEDDTDLSDLYIQTLTTLGYAATPAQTLDQAREQLQTQSFDLIMCDLHVGGKNALNLLNEPEIRPKLNRSGVLVISGDDTQRRACFEMGFPYFVAKPVTPPTLIRRLRELGKQEDRLTRYYEHIIYSEYLHEFRMLEPSGEAFDALLQATSEIIDGLSPAGTLGLLVDATSGMMPLARAARSTTAWTQKHTRRPSLRLAILQNDVLIRPMLNTMMSAGRSRSFAFGIFKADEREKAFAWVAREASGQVE